MARLGPVREGRFAVPGFGWPGRALSRMDAQNSEWEKLLRKILKNLSENERFEMLDRMCLVTDAISQMLRDPFFPGSKPGPSPSGKPNYPPPFDPGWN